MLDEKHISYIDGLVQERRNSIANALELRLSCTNPSMRLWLLVDEVYFKLLFVLPT